MDPQSRPFDPERDVVRIRDFLASLVGRIGQERTLHTGDWLWRLFLREDRTAAARDDLRVWTDGAGAIAGYCWYTPPGEIDIQVDPAHSPDGALEASMVAWAQRRLDAEPNAAAASLTADAFEHDERKRRIIESLGFVAGTEPAHNLFHQRLTDTGVERTSSLDRPVRSIAGDEDVSDRVAIHREVWHPSRFTEASYRAVRAAPGFLPDLDLVAEAPDGRFASYCICWHDPVNQIGEFEPVGTRTPYRRQGYSRAVIAEGLRRLRSLGATEAIVYALASDEPSNALYAACGFSVAGRDLPYVRPTPVPSAVVPNPIGGGPEPEPEERADAR